MASADLHRTPSPAADAAGHLPLALLRQYAAGTLTPAEQHRVEAHTLDCPRCADILAGLSATDAATTDHAVAQLRQRLHARVAAEETTEVPAAAWPWARVAAVLLLLVLSTVAFFWLRTTPQNTPSAPVATVARSRSAAPAAKEEKEVAAAAPAAPAPATASRVAPTPVPAPAVAVAPARPRRGIRQRPAVAATQSATPSAPVPAVAEPAAVAAGEVAGSVAAAPATPDSVPAAASGRVAVAARAATPPPGSVGAFAKGRYAAPRPETARLQSSVDTTLTAGQRLVRGKVLEQQNGQPLPGVTVLVPGTNIATATAADGSFKLAVPAATTKLGFSSVGFIHQEKKLNPDSLATLTLAMAPDTKSLNEVVMVAREKAPAPVSIAPLPTGGYRAWNQYLRDSLQYPEKALEDRREGTVRLRFTVSADGQVQDIEVVRKVSAEIDEEAIRLLKAGPAWHAGVQNGRRIAQKVQVNIPFRLEMVK